MPYILNQLNIETQMKLTFSSIGCEYSSTNFSRSIMFSLSTSHACVQNESCTPVRIFFTSNVLIDTRPRFRERWRSNKIRVVKKDRTCETHACSFTGNCSHHHMRPVKGVNIIWRKSCSLSPDNDLQKQKQKLKNSFRNRSLHRTLFPCLSFVYKQNQGKAKADLISFTLKRQGLKGCLYLHSF